MSETRDSIADIWGARTPYRGEWPVRVDVRTTEEPDRWVQSCCVLCSNGCGMDIGVKDGRIVGVRGRAGRPGQPGAARAQGAPRLGGQPQPRPAHHAADPPRGKLVEATWDEAMGLIVERSQRDPSRSSRPTAIGIYTTGPDLHRGLLHAGRRSARRGSGRRTWTATPGSARPRPPAA